MASTSGWPTIQTESVDATPSVRIYSLSVRRMHEPTRFLSLKPLGKELRRYPCNARNNSESGIAR